MEDAQRLQGLAQRASAKARDARQRLCDVAESARLRRGTVALGQRQYGLCREDGVFEELDTLGIGLRTAFFKTLAHPR